MCRQTILVTVVVVAMLGAASFALHNTAKAEFFWGGPYFYDDTPPQMGYVYPGVPYTNRYGAPYYQGYGAPYSNYYVRPFPPVWAPNYNSYGNYYGPTVGSYDAYYGY
jgi:hypothetical protein